MTATNMCSNFGGKWFPPGNEFLEELAAIELPPGIVFCE